jgi:hypothetical protein
LVATHCETQEEINRARKVFSQSDAQNLGTSLETISQSPIAA